MQKPILILICLLFAQLVQGQQTPYEWRLGVSGGYANYYGDLSPHRIRGLSNWDAIHHLFYFNEHYVDQVSFKISAEKRLSPSIGLMLSYGQYTFAMSDRYLQRDGTLMVNAPNFDRALNFQNTTRDLGMALVFKPDNDILLPANSFIAPYFTLGGGYLDFDVRGDLLDNQGNPYDYAAGAVANNRIYETALPPLRTENPEGYSTGAFYANLGLGIRFRLGPRVELFVQSDFIHAFTDYLDDVSGTYRETYEDPFQAYAAQPGTNVINPDNPLRGDPSSPNDWIIYHGVGLKINLGFTKKDFSAPRLSSFYPDYSYTSTRTTRRQASEEADVDEEEQDMPSPTNITNIQLGAVDRRTDSLTYKAQLLEWDQQILSRENKILSGRLEQQRLSQRQQELGRELEMLRQDTLLTSNARDSLMELSRERRHDLRYSQDSIQRREREILAEIDSLQQLKGTYRMEKPGEAYDAETFLWNLGEMTPDAPTQEPVMVPDTLARVPTEQPTAPEPQQREEVPNDLEERIQRLEAENLRLQAEQEALREVPQQNIYLPPASPPAGDTRLSPRDRAAARRAQFRNEERRPLINIFRGGGQREETDGQTPQTHTPVMDGRDVERLMIAQEIAHVVGASLFGHTFPSPLTMSPAATERPETDLEEPETPVPAETEEAATAAVPDTVFTAPELQLLKSKTEVYFRINEIEPTDAELQKLAPLAEFVQANESYILSLRGYADNTGNVNYNLRLISSRIEAVSNFLQEHFGLAAEQIQTEVGGQIVRGTGRSPHDRDRKVEARIVERD